MKLSTTGDAFESAEDIVRMIQIIGRPPIIILGTLGNVLTFLTMQGGSLKNLSTCFYMAILALADTDKYAYPVHKLRTKIMKMLYSNCKAHVDTMKFFFQVFSW